MVTLSMVPVNGKGDAYHRFLYVAYEGGEGACYDLARGPFELRNIAPTLALDLLQRLHPVLQANMICSRQGLPGRARQGL